MNDHELFHNLQVADGCKTDWDGMQGGSRVRKCGICQFKVFKVDGLNECDRRALLCSQGVLADTRLYRRVDGKFVLGDCLGKRLPPNMGTGVAFALLPMGSLVAFHPALATLLTLNALCWAVPTLAWLLVGCALVCRTRSATLSGVFFAVFVLPALLIPMILLGSLVP